MPDFPNLNHNINNTPPEIKKPEISLDSADYSDSPDSSVSSSSSGLQAHSGVYISSKEKYEDLNASGSSLLIVGLILTFILIIDLSRIIRLPIGSFSRVLTDSVIGILALLCLLGAHSTFKKANLVKAEISFEQKQRRQIVNWCVFTYSAAQIDKMIDAAESVLPDSIEVLCLKRMDMIRSYLIREYHIDDEPYLDDLCEEIFQKIFE